MALMIWGKPAAGGKYAAIAALTNIPATLFATIVYELIFVDSSRGSLTLISYVVQNSPFSLIVLPHAQQDFLNGHKAHLTHKTMDPSERRQPKATSSVSSTEKNTTTHV